MNARTIALCCLCLAGAAAMPGAAPSGALARQNQPMAAPDQRNLLTVSANAQVRAPANELTIALGVTTEARKDLRLAIAENNDKASKIQAALIAAGAKQGEVSTDRYSVNPVYSYPKGERPRLEGYTISNFVRVRTPNLDLAGPLIQAATEAGANNVEHVSFGLADPGAYRRIAIAQATERAMGDARAAADAAGIRLIRVANLNIDHANAPSPQPMTMARGMAGMEADGASIPTLTPGSIEVFAAVTIQFEIHTPNLGKWSDPEPAPGEGGGHGHGGGEGGGGGGH